MVSEDDERTSMEEVVKLEYGPFNRIYFTLGGEPVMPRWTEGVGSNCNYFLLSIFLHEDGAIGNVAGVSGEYEELREVGK